MHKISIEFVYYCQGNANENVKSETYRRTIDNLLCKLSTLRNVVVCIVLEVNVCKWQLLLHIKF